MATFIKRVTFRAEATGPEAPAPFQAEGDEAQARARAEAWVAEQRQAGRDATIIRARTRYQARVRLKDHPQQSATFNRLTDAKRWAAGIETAIHDGRHFKTTEAKRRTLGDLIDRYARDILPTKKPKTQGPQMGQLMYWKTHLGAKYLADCTPAVIAEQRDALKAAPIPSQAKDDAYREALATRRHSPATVNRYLAALSHVFTYAVKEIGWMDDNPLTKVSKEKEPRGRCRYLSEEERDRLLAACRDSASPDLYPAVVMALATGARQMEIMGMRWPQVDLKRQTATLEDTKNGDRRVLHLDALPLAILTERAKVRRIDTDLIFPARDRPRRYSQLPQEVKPLDLRTPFETALKRADVQDFTWHDLRHTAASYLAMSGASLAEIAAFLGHKTLAMVWRYAHLSESHNAGVVSRMNAKMFAAIGPGAVGERAANTSAG
ncbi:MAG: tyrosine-type recombinase/integrase [Chromatiaceae bacterium]|nr:tyrosine-type recombinase/integrase [Chromatiaceae bacterium]